MRPFRSVTVIEREQLLVDLRHSVASPFLVWVPKGSSPAAVAPTSISPGFVPANNADYQHRPGCRQFAAAVRDHTKGFSAYSSSHAPLLKERRERLLSTNERGNGDLSCSTLVAVGVSLLVIAVLLASPSASTIFLALTKITNHKRLLVW